jgi:hypothetical protein
MGPRNSRYAGILCYEDIHPGSGGIDSAASCGTCLSSTGFSTSSRSLNTSCISESASASSMYWPGRTPVIVGIWENGMMWKFAVCAARLAGYEDVLKHADSTNNIKIPGMFFQPCHTYQEVDPAYSEYQGFSVSFWSRDTWSCSKASHISEGFFANKIHGVIMSISPCYTCYLRLF